MTVFIALSILCAPAPDLAHEDMRELAVVLSDEGRFVEAAVRFEAIAAAGGPSVVHFEAGQMRFAAGHMAHAARHFQAYIASGLDADDLSLTQSRLAKAATGTRLIEVRLSPAIATTIRAHRIGDPPDSQRPDLDTPIHGGLAALRLDPGTWELRIDAPDHVPLRQNIEVTDIRTPIELRLDPAPAPAPAPTIGPAPRPATCVALAARRSPAQWPCRWGWQPSPASSRRPSPTAIAAPARRSSATSATTAQPWRTSASRRSVRSVRWSASASHPGRC